MRPSSIILMLLLSSPAVYAQTTAGSTATIFVSPPASESCPVNFSVKRSSHSGMVMVKPNGAVFTQGLQIDFLKSPETEILKADITVHGMSARGHMMPAASRASRPDDASETFVLTPGAGLPLLHSSISTKKISAITWVELTRIDYANGTTWQASPESRCTAAPSLFVLVDAGQ
jgi:hypothetical protein